MNQPRQVLRVLELFSGTGSISTAFRSAGHDCDSLDLDSRFEPTFCINVLDWKYKELPRHYYDAIWCSIPCENYSIARSRSPRDLMLADSLVLRTQEILTWFAPRCWFIENPAGSMLWRRFSFPFLVTTSYCSYGRRFRKHTKIASNCVDFSLKDPCGGAGVCESMVGNIHMEHAQKGGGGASNVYHTRDELHRIPPGLCMDVVLFCECGQAAPEERG